MSHYNSINASQQRSDPSIKSPPDKEMKLLSHIRKSNLSRLQDAMQVSDSKFSKLIRTLRMLCHAHFDVGRPLREQSQNAWDAYLSEAKTLPILHKYQDAWPARIYINRYFGNREPTPGEDSDTNPFEGMVIDGPDGLAARDGDGKTIFDRLVTQKAPSADIVTDLDSDTYSDYDGSPVQPIVSTPRQELPIHPPTVTHPQPRKHLPRQDSRTSSPQPTARAASSSPEAEARLYRALQALDPNLGAFLPYFVEIGIDDEVKLMKMVKWPPKLRETWLRSQQEALHMNSFQMESLVICLAPANAPAKVPCEN
ncbi:hypothetical protein BV22DRAFT_1191796 [Leucogyrophana mollusca]|uniref:Uncharacterized protein n=1 Tax=Leucogyrophana mollusca TaxID=85980 RepID=A0ACB8BV10_9AGAM|nr:hypothetical protein BV22DRAFT_1191796 [Leucogyrophana mollusca]